MLNNFFGLNNSPKPREFDKASFPTLTSLLFTFYPYLKVQQDKALKKKKHKQDKNIVQ